MNTLVKFEIGELLLKKGFKKEGFLQKVWLGDSFEGDKVTSIYRLGASSVLPTISDVVMWLYEKHGIWITVYTMDKWLPNGNDREQLFDYSLKQMKLGLIDIPKKPEEFNSPTEAYEAAIEYALKNLI